MLDAVSLEELAKKMADIASRHASGQGYLPLPPLNTRESEITCGFIRLVGETHTMQKRISEYAQELRISPNYLSRIVKKCTGLPPMYYIHQRFLSMAKKMAAETPLSMKEIGYKLGFNDTAHFSKFFKTNAGLTFSEYKKSWVLQSA